MEDGRERAPAAIAGQQVFFPVNGVAVFGFNGFKGADSGDIVAGFFFQAPLPDPVRGRYAEVS